MLKFFAEKMWIAFAMQKLLTFFQQKNIRILCIESTKIVNEMIPNELVNLTMLWTTGPCLSALPSSVWPSIFPFPENNLSKYQWIFTKLGMCIDIVEIRFGIANGQNSYFFDRVFCPLSVLSFPDDNLSNYQWMFTKLGVCIDNGQILSIFDSHLPATS